MLLQYGSMGQITHTQKIGHSPGKPICLSVNGCKKRSHRKYVAHKRFSVCPSYDASHLPDACDGGWGGFSDGDAAAEPRQSACFVQLRDEGASVGAHAGGTGGGLYQVGVIQVTTVTICKQIDRMSASIPNYLMLRRPTMLVMSPIWSLMLPSDPPRTASLTSILRLFLQFHHNDMGTHDIDAFAAHRCASF